MGEAYWEMERRRLMGNRLRDIAGYVALEYPRESVTAVLRPTDSGSPPNEPVRRGARPARAVLPAGSPTGGPLT